jgi:hypothetical protein
MIPRQNELPGRVHPFKGKLETILETATRGGARLARFKRLREFGNFAGGRKKRESLSKPPPSASRPRLPAQCASRHMPDASPHCKRVTIEVGGAWTERLVTKGDGAMQAARGRRWSRSRSRRRPLCIAVFTIARSTVGRWTQVRALISNARYEQADQARPNRRQPRLISRYVGTRKPIRRRATCLTILGSALASPSCA